MIQQVKYAKDLLRKFDVDKAKSISTPMHPSQVLEADEDGEKVSETLYRGMIGSLLYLTASRPDLQLSVGIYARFQSNPKESHLNTVKRILRYLVGNMQKTCSESLIWTRIRPSVLLCIFLKF